ncbi:hypothetical protein EKO04_001000 [Ascochyta lentis]|uniref:Uncharacterized protein n=1 Tax=Ascochyta lentis TaxID=205686 RepID=A0A8H7MHQ5_9PLEO|nr:hypothetical protein EKO04_001000 [Ascochyta lentis]
MLARASSDAGARLRRSKSASTVHRHGPRTIQPLDPNVAQQHAIAAATAAYTRSQAQETFERKAKGSVELSRSKSTASRKSLKSQGSHFPPREMSIRSVPTRNDAQTSSSHRLFLKPASNIEKSPSSNPRSGSERPSSLARPSSTQPSVTSSEYGRPASQPKSHRQGAASSITSQQIRKARSMYYASSVQTGSPIARPPAKYLTTPPPVSANPVVSTAPAAYVPTRRAGPSPLAVPRFPVAVAPNETIDEARDKHLQDFQQRPVKHKPSLFLAPFKKRQVKRTSSPVLSTNYQIAEDSVIDITVDDFIPQPDINDRRSFSGSLKRKIKRVFRRTSNKSAILPVQQIEASREYFGIVTTDDALPQINDSVEIPRPNEMLLESMRSRTPSVEGGCQYLIRSKSHSSSNDSAHSNRSLHSEAAASHTSASRVTSWGTSASGETLTQRAIKRLTVIHEAKDSISSLADRTASVTTKRKSIPNPSLSAFKDPMYMESLAEETSTPSVDPKRVFSALMREIDASRSTEAPLSCSYRTPGAESDVFESSKTKELHFTGRELHSSASRDLCLSINNEKKLSSRRPASAAAHSIQSKKSSIKSFGRAIRSTIRTVTPGERRSSPSPEDLINAQLDTNTPSPDASSSSQEHRENLTAIFKGLRISKKKTGSSAQQHPLDVYIPTSEQIEMRVAKAKSRWQTPLDESGTSQFPQETDRLYTVTDFSKRPASAQVHVAPGPSSPPKSSTAQASKLMQTPLSPSVYSRNTDGASILPNDSVISFNSPYELENRHNGGSAVILTSQSVRSYVVGTPSPNRPSSSRSSRDWKAWLSHEVSGFETTSQEKLTIHQKYVAPSGVHTTNSAEATRTSHADSDDTTVLARESFDTSTPRVEREQPVAIPSEAVRKVEKIASSKELLGRTFSVSTTVLKRGDQHLDTHKNNAPAQTPSSTKLEQKYEISTATTTPLHSPEGYRTSMPSNPSSAPPPLLATPGSAHMNERFPFLNTGKRSNSNNSSLSQSTKSPTSSVGSSSKSLKMTPGPKVVYSDLSAPATGSTTHHVPNTAVRRAQELHRSKENITPPSMGGHTRPRISPLGLVPRPKSLQPLASTALNGISTKMAQYNADAADLAQSKIDSSSTAVPVARPRLRATIRPLSPEKLSRRPRSAFDLRSTPSPRPASELRRPALRLKASPLLMASDIEPKSGVETGNHDAMSEEYEREGNATPGQRMAERFLKERKSNTVLERGMRKSIIKLAREDTPAFL